MRGCKYFYLSKLIRQCCFEKRTASPTQNSIESKSEILTSIEVLAFFTGIAIIFSLINGLFLQQFMQIDEFVYGLTFANESLSLKKISYSITIFIIPISILFAVMCEQMIQKTKKEKTNRNTSEKSKNKLSSFSNKYQQSFLFRILLCLIIILPAVAYLICAYMKLISDNTIFIIQTGYIFIISIIPIIFVKCTVPCRALLFFTLLMLLSWICISFYGRSIDKNTPVMITMNDGSTVNASRCTISNEGLAVLSNVDGKHRIIPVSRIKEIVRIPTPVQQPTPNH